MGVERRKSVQSLRSKRTPVHLYKVECYILFIGKNTIANNMKKKKKKKTLHRKKICLIVVDKSYTTENSTFAKCDTKCTINETIDLQTCKIFSK